MKAARTRVLTLSCFIALALQTIGTSAGSQEKYGKYYPQYSSQSYQQPYTSNRFFENSAIKQHFQNLWNRQTDYKKPYSNRDRYSGIPGDRKQQNYESIPQTDAVTHTMLPEENVVKQSPTSSTPHISKLDEDAPNVSKSSEPLNDFQPNPQILTEKPQQYTEENIQTLDQIQSTLVTLREDIPLSQPQNNEPQTRYKREFSSQQPSDSAMYQKEVKGNKSSHKRHRSRQKHNTRSKHEGNKESKTNITTKRPARTSQKSKSRLKEKEHLEATTETKHKMKQGIQQITEKDAEVSTNRGVGKRNVHKVSKEIASKKHKNILNTLIDILRGQKSTYDISNAENQRSELDKDFNFIEQSSIKPTSEFVQTTSEKPLSDEISPEPTQYTLTNIEQVLTEETKQSTSDQGTSSLIDKPSSKEPFREPTQSIFTPVELASSETPEQLNVDQYTPDPADKTSNEEPAPQVLTEKTEQSSSDKAFPVPANTPLSKELSPASTQPTIISVEQVSTMTSQQLNPEQVTSVPANNASSEEPSSPQTGVEQVPTENTKQPIPVQAVPFPTDKASTEEPILKSTQSPITLVEQVSTEKSGRPISDQINPVPADNPSSEEPSFDRIQFIPFSVKQVSTEQTEQMTFSLASITPSDKLSSENSSPQPTQSTFTPFEQVLTEKTEQLKFNQSTPTSIGKSSIEPTRFTLAPVEQGSTEQSENPTSEQGTPLVLPDKPSSEPLSFVSTQSTLSLIERVLTETSESTPNQTIGVAANKSLSEQPSTERTQSTLTPVVQVSTEKTEQITTNQATPIPVDKATSEDSSALLTQSTFIAAEYVSTTQFEQPTSMQSSRVLIKKNSPETSTELSEQESIETTQLITPIDLATKQSEHSTMITESTTPKLQDFQPRSLTTMKETKAQDLTQLIQEITTTHNEIERIGRYNPSKIKDLGEIQKAIESDIKFRTLIVPDKTKPGGHCYCSCEMNSRPIFITLN
ncbi:hypothetical protein K1T71_009008 [Dendrolimus kikuchii]|uniref:Uncharacterized protein n=1 Tax=Dendrolimus kikuchii TaxID=765133 RepID=A0ACC1CVW5_9NEOP|nr:hypothetical protein K1T71_009008 [Dendrolimus kikuchii]